MGKPLSVCRSGRHDLTVEANVVRDKRGRRRGCRPCRDETAAKWRAKNVEYAKKSRFKNLYGITVEEADEMARQQDGKCKICLQPPANVRGLHVDHDHQTGKVRGLLCSNCNSMLGYARDNPVTLRKGIDYLLNAR